MANGNGTGKMLIGLTVLVLAGYGGLTLAKRFMAKQQMNAALARAYYGRRY